MLISDLKVKILTAFPKTGSVIGVILESKIEKRHHNIFEPPHDKTNKMACAPSEDSDQPGHPPSLIRIFAVRMMEP